MGAAIGLREDFDGSGLRRLAKASKDAGQSRRLLTLAAIYDGGARSDAARIGGVGLQVIRDWVLRFNAEGPGGWLTARRRAIRPNSTIGNAERWPGLSRAGRSRRSMAWCAGGSRTWHFGYWRNTASRWTRRP